jgi:transposase
MRGHHTVQTSLLCYISVETRVPKRHPLRAIKALTDRALESMSSTFDAMYSASGRRSIPPERLLKASLLMALYSVRSERQLCEQLDYNLLFRWLLDMDVVEPAFHPTTFTNNRDRLLEHDVAAEFLQRVLDHARAHDLVSEEHFSVDGTLIEAWASMKSFRPKGDDAGDSNGWADFKGTKRSNDTHESKTDPEARLIRKGRGREARLSFMAHALMDNRNGLVIDLRVSPATGTAEREAALAMLDDLGASDKPGITVGADKGYDARAFLDACTERGVEPHVARRKNSTQPPSTPDCNRYQASQKVRRRIEEIFGWLKTVAGLRRTRYRGCARTNLLAGLGAVAYNLLRISRLAPVRS